MRALAILTGILALTAAAELPDTIEFNRDIRPILSDKCFACHGFDEKERKGDLRLDTADGAKDALIPGQPDKSELIARIHHADPDEHMPPQKSEKRLSDREKALLGRWIAQGAAYEQHWAYIPPKSEFKQFGAANGIDVFINRKLREKQFKPVALADPITLIRRLSFDLTGLPPSPELLAEFAAGKPYETIVDEMLAKPQFGERMAMYWLDVVRYADSNGYHSDEPRQIAPYRDYVIAAFNSNKPYDVFVQEQLAGDLMPEATEEQKIASGFNMLLQTTAEGGAQAKEYLAKYAADRVRNTSTIFLGITMGCAECHDHKFDPFSSHDFYAMQAFFADIREAGVGKPPAYPISSPEINARLKAVDAEITTAQAALSAATEALGPAQQAWEKEVVGESSDLPSFGTWQAIGPFKADSFDKAHDSDFGPEKGIDLKAPIGGLKWEAKPQFVDDKIHALSGVNAAVYLYRSVSSTDAQTIGLSLGSDDGFKIWLNGELIENQKVARGVAKDQNKVDVRLKAGDNHLLLKISQGGGGFGFYFRPTEAGPPAEILIILKIAEPDRNSAQRKSVRDYFAGFAPGLKAARTRVKELEGKKKAIRRERPRTLMTVTTTPRTIRLLPRGDWMSDAGPEMSPQIPSLFGKLDTGDRRPTRLDLAQWITAPNNPLTARTYVNRIWKLFFGHGISSRLDDLGSQGQWPTHPELLDWLAIDFVASGWDTKHLVKLILSSEAYRRDSRDTPALREADPGNAYYARQGRWRLDAEMVRDNALAISGLLVHRIGGPSVKPYQPVGYWRHMNFPKRSWRQSEGEGLYRRGLYTWWQRMFLHPSLVAFDAPSREEACVERVRSNTPQQALALLNDPTYTESARVLSERILAQHGDRIDWVCRAVLSRPPLPAERALLDKLLAEHRAEYDADAESANAILSNGMHPAKSANPSELAAWNSVARVLLNLHETITRR
jgi:hypothetical protein